MLVVIWAGGEVRRARHPGARGERQATEWPAFANCNNHGECRAYFEDGAHHHDAHVVQRVREVLLELGFHFAGDARIGGLPEDAHGLGSFLEELLQHVL